MVRPLNYSSATAIATVKSRYFARRSGGYHQFPAVEPEVDVIVFEPFEDVRQEKISLDLAHEFVGGELPFVDDIDIVPTCNLAHGSLDAGMVKVKIPVLPGDD